MDGEAKLADEHTSPLIEVSAIELSYALKEGLDEADALHAKRLQVRHGAAFPDFSVAVGIVAIGVRQRRKVEAREATHQAALVKERLRREGETDNEWALRLRAIEKREKDRLRRQRWRKENAHLGPNKPKSYSGTNRNGRRSQRSPAFYKARDEIKTMRADLSMLLFLIKQIEACKAQLAEIKRLGSSKWKSELEITIGANQYECRAIRERYGLPEDIEQKSVHCMDFPPDEELALAYVDLCERVGETDHWRGRAITRRDIFAIWKDTLEQRIKQKHGCDAASTHG